MPPSSFRNAAHTCGLACALLLGSTGCAAVADVQAGYAGSTRVVPERHGGAVQVGVSLTQCEGSFMSIGHCAPVTFGGGLAVRGRISETATEFSLVPHAALLVNANEPAGVKAYLRGGVTLPQLGSVDGKFAGGLGGPSGELGLLVPLPGRDQARPHLVASGYAEYDVRATTQPNEGFFGVRLGVAYAGK